MSPGTKIKHYCKRFYDYVLYDFKEIAFPSSIPDPPGSRPIRRKAAWEDHKYVWKTASQLYLKSWKTKNFNLDAELAGQRSEQKKEGKETTDSEMSMVEELAVAAKAGSEHIKPALQRIYMTKVSAYKDALKSFVVGYQEGLTEVMKSSDKINESRMGPSSKDEKPAS